jgi:D-alanyl-D-alanine carboxypeptidase/D-alanyl-D-alanine-endopeptidase (penicillin-binding protein 4)
MAACGGTVKSAERGRATASTTTFEPAAPARLRHTAGTTPKADPPRSGGESSTRRPGRALLRKRIGQDLAGSGSQTGVLVVDLTAHDPLEARRENVRRMPASLEKLYTSVALLKMLGPNAHLHTKIVGSGHMAARGVWHGNLFLVGGGDPTLGDGAWNQEYEGGYGPTLLQLVAQLRHDGIRRVTGRVYGDGALFDADRGGPGTHNRADIPDYDGEMSALVFDHGSTAPGYSPATFAARELAITMRDSGIRTKLARKPGVAPVHARQLASVTSPPLQPMLHIMDTYSDDLFADLFAKQLGQRFFGGRGTLAKGAIEIRQDLAEHYGLHPVVHDGSGLDKADRSSPADFVKLLSEIWGTRIGRELHADMAVVGKSGTVQGLGIGTYAAGHCVAKTGTLNYVTNLAGYCNTKGGHTLAFAVMLDGPSNDQSIPVLSRVVSAIAAY